MIANAHGGTLTGESRATPIAFGIERPVRTMTLKEPLIIGPRSLSAIGVRTADFGTTSSIPDADAPGDPDESIVVTGRKKRDPRRYRIDLGSDVLGTCSSLVFDKMAKQVRLSCR